MICKQNIASIFLGLSLAMGPVAGLPQGAPAPDGKAEGLSLMEQGMQLFFRQLLADANPALEDMKQALTALEPMVRDLGRMIGDVSNYLPPEQLANGDIIIRRKPGAPPPPNLAPDGGPENMPLGPTDL